MGSSSTSRCATSAASPRRASNRIGALVIADIGLQLLLIVVGLAAFFHPDVLLDPIHLGMAPTWGDAIFALGVATVVFTGLESAAGLSGEITVTRRGSSA